MNHECTEIDLLLCACECDWICSNNKYLPAYLPECSTYISQPINIRFYMHLPNVSICIYPNEKCQSVYKMLEGNIFQHGRYHYVSELPDSKLRVSSQAFPERMFSICGHL